MMNSPSSVSSNRPALATACRSRRRGRRGAEPTRRGAPHHVLYHTTRDRARTHATVHDTGDRGKITAEGSAYGTGIVVGRPGGSGTTERRWKGPSALPVNGHEQLPLSPRRGPPQS